MSGWRGLVTVSCDLRSQFQVSDLEKGMERVLAERFAYILHKTKFQLEVEHMYNDRYGATPLHRSSTEYRVFGGNAWGVR